QPRPVRLICDSRHLAARTHPRRRIAARLRQWQPPPTMSVDRPTAPFLIISSDLIDSRMAGQGIRALELARALAREIPVRLAVPETCDITLPGVDVALYQYGDIASLAQAARGVSGVFAEPFILQAYPFL